jgi:DNA-binding NarL/FixJ family response regulator
MSQTDVLVVDGQPVFRRGIVACLDLVEGIGRIEEAASVGDCWENPALGEADVVLLDVGLEGAAGFVSELLRFTDTRVVGLAAAADRDRLLSVLEAGASAALERDHLTPEVLVLGIRAAGAGTTSLVASFGTPSPTAVEPRGPELTGREQQVLGLVADGLPTREIAVELSYSERTVKKVLGDVVMKLGARSRSQAIARAVRQGII